MLAGYSSLLIAVTTERERGMLKRLRGTPMPSWIFLAGKIMRTVVVVAVTVAVLVAVGAGVYHVPVQGHTVIGLAVYTVAGTACMCALGLASTRACATTEAASVAGPFLTLILGFVSGVFIPVSMMPAWTLDVGSSSPWSTWPRPCTGFRRPGLDRHYRHRSGCDHGVGRRRDRSCPGPLPAAAARQLVSRNPGREAGKVVTGRWAAAG